MIPPQSLPAYKQQLTAYFDGLGSRYDGSDIHRQLAARLVACARLQANHAVLDIATGTGWVALLASALVGPGGKVIGVDLSEAMLERARTKATGLTNVSFVRADAEKLSFPAASFDRILCGSALAYLSDIPRALRHWHQLLRPSGLLAFSGFADTAMINTIVLAQVATRYGVILPPFNEATGTAERCRLLLEQAGFVDIEVYTDDLSYPGQGTPTDLQKSWDELLSNPWTLPLHSLPSPHLTACRNDYLTAMGALADKDGGIWNDMLTYTAVGWLPGG
jgi:ubiquinone/menaquinone biosynthesis C-methylase UbiE